MKVALDAKLAAVAQLNRSSGFDVGYATAAEDDVQAQPVVQAYNQAVAPFISTQLTQQTKDANVPEMRDPLVRLGSLKRELSTALDRLQGNALLSCVKGLAVFTIMSKQI